MRVSKSALGIFLNTFIDDVRRFLLCLCFGTNNNSRIAFLEQFHFNRHGITEYFQSLAASLFYGLNYICVSMYNIFSISNSFGEIEMFLFHHKQITFSGNKLPK